MTTRWIKGLGAALIVGSWSASGAAADFPKQPIRWIIPYTGGGAYDALARGLGPILGRNLGVTVVVENVPGPDGYNRIHSARPDGHTIGMAEPVGEFGQALVTPLPYKLENMTWLGRITGSVNLVVASKKSGITSFDQLKAAQKPVRIASFGVSAPLVQMILVAEKAKFPIAPVNFRSIGDFIFATVRGDVDVAILGTQVWLKHIEAGNVVPLLAWSDEPDPRVPGTPHLGQVGLPELVPLLNHRSVIAPPKLPADVTAALIAAFRKTVEEGEGLAFLKKANFELNPMWGAPFEKIVMEAREAVGRYEPVLKRVATQNQ